VDWTPYPELNVVLEALRLEITRALGENLVGMYLQGSFAVGDFDEHSDCDFIVIVKAALSSPQVQALNEMHEMIYAMPYEWAKHLEGSYFTVEEIAGEPGGNVWYVDHGHTKLERSNHCNTLVVRWILEHHGISLVGPPAQTFFPPIQTDALKQEMRRTLLDWGADILRDPEPYRNRFYQGFITINYCRMLRDISLGEVGSKKQASEWAMKHLDAKWHGLIERSWSCRPDPATSVRTLPDPDDFAATLEFVQFAIDLAN